MKIIQGNLVKLAKQGKFELITHGCNCFCAMGRGIAKTIREEFPQAYSADLETIKGDKTKLGTCSFANVTVNGKELIIVNSYTQYHWNGNGVEVLADYNAIRSCMKWIRNNHSGKKIGIPKIGAGLARGDWDIISKIITEELQNEDLTLVEFI